VPEWNINLDYDAADQYSAELSVAYQDYQRRPAKEMRERIELIIGLEARSLWMGTFHSIFAKILRKEHEKLGFPYNFTIYAKD
jgi:superfamily I DNA/RNA helicase